jgi:cell division protein ZapB
MTEPNLKLLEAKIDELIALCTHLQHENTSLREREHQLLQERSQLIEKGNAARQRVEAMILRLKNMQEH